MNMRGACEVTRHESRQLAGWHDEVHDGGNYANDGQKISKHFHGSISLIAMDGARHAGDELA
jgi:hypothetical protein